MVNKRHHYVPQYYLKQFRADEGNRLLVCMVEPYRCVGLGAIKGQCQHDHFYGKDGPTDAMLQETESAIAPTLYAVNKLRAATVAQWQALRLLAVQLHLRTRKAAELAKVFPRFFADKVITAAIKNGELPEPKGGWSAEMMDFGGVPQSLLGHNLLACYFETTTLRCKLLAAPRGTFFITSDNPAIMLNQFAADAKGVRDYVGFAQSGFQFVLPLSPSLCAFLYDPFIYKVGSRSDDLVEVCAEDVEILNSLQVQSADRCLYAHCPEAERIINQLVSRYAKLRKPNNQAIKSYAQNDKETLLKISNPPMVLPKRWLFCGYLKNIRKKVGEKRDPAYTHMVQLLVEDIEKNPGNMDFEARLDRLSHEDLPIPGLRGPAFPRVRLPEHPSGWTIGS